MLRHARLDVIHVASLFVVFLFYTASGGTPAIFFGPFHIDFVPDDELSIVLQQRTIHSQVG